jgi:hypothetical protein
MREHLRFLKVSSVVVKIAAWILLFFGGIGGIAVLFKLGSADLGVVYPRWAGVVILAAYVFIFFFFYLVAKITDLLIKIISAIGGSSSGGNEIKKE